MARVTIEDCLERVPNRFSLIHLAFQRVKQLRSGAAPLVQSRNKEVVVALREIAAGKVTYPFDDKLKHGMPALETKIENKEGDPLLSQS
jgi:DNA-directed RNA polymerase subunit omega